MALLILPGLCCALETPTVPPTVENTSAAHTASPVRTALPTSAGTMASTYAPPVGGGIDPGQLILWIAGAIPIVCVAVLVVLGYARSPEVLANPASRTGIVLAEIKKRPGCRETDLVAATEFSRGSVMYQLKRLIQEGEVIRREFHKTTRYYPADAKTKTDRIVAAVLSQEKSGRVFLDILDHAGTTQKENAVRLNITRSTVRWHLVRLSRDGLLEERKEKKEKFYRITSAAEDAGRRFRRQE